jgi:transcriptional regulator with XRE-family HTH domain
LDVLHLTRLATNLRRLRHARRLRQVDLAVPGVVARSTISALERAAITNPSETVLQAVAHGLGVTVDDLLAWPNDQAKQLAQEVRIAGELVDRGHLLEAIDRFEGIYDAARRFDLPTMAHLAATRLARLHGQCGRGDQALVFSLEALLQAIAVTPSTVESLRHAADSLWQTGAWHAARACYQALLQRIAVGKADRLRMLVNLGYAYLYSGHYGDAVQAFRTTLHEVPQGGDGYRCAGAYLGLGRALRYQQHWRDAGEAAGRALCLGRTYRWRDVIQEAEALQRLCEVPTMPTRRGGQAVVRSVLAAVPAGSGFAVERAQVYDLLAALELQQGYAVEAQDAADHGLAEIGATLDPRAWLLKARLLWSRAVSKAHQGLPDAPVDRAWAEDLLAMVGVPAGYPDLLPAWPVTAPPTGTGPGPRIRLPGQLSVG